MKLLETFATTRATEPQTNSMCSLTCGGATFGVATHKVREVLGPCDPVRVPLAPSYIGGVIPYRGEVLTLVSLHALLHLSPTQQQSSVLVLDDDATAGPFGLLVDSVGGVVMLEQSAYAANPSTLDEAARTLFTGSYRMQNGLLVQLAVERLSPARLRQTDLFRHGIAARGREEMGCAH